MTLDAIISLHQAALPPVLQVLAAISGGADVGDTATLANPAVVDEIQKLHGRYELAHAA